MKTKLLAVESPQGAAGLLARESQFAFNYDRSATPDRAISLSMPLRATSYSGNQLPPIFLMNRPEGWLSKEIARRLAKLSHVDDFELLRYTGQHQIGRLTYRHPDDPPSSPSAYIGLGEILSTRQTVDLFAHLVNQYLAAGISGVQPKVMVPDADQLAVGQRMTAVGPGLVVKSGGDQYPSLPVNEFLCMDAARRAGLEVPDFWLSENQGLFVLRRFDVLADGSHLGFEDMSVLMGAQPDDYGRFKYASSYEAVASAVAAYCRPTRSEALSSLFASVALSVMVRNGDAHLKNFGLVYDHPGGLPPRLAPTYDVVTTSVYPAADDSVDRALALNLHGRRRYPSRDELLSFGRVHCAVSDPGAVVDRIATAMLATLAEHGSRLDAATLSLLSREWDSGLVSVATERSSSVRFSTPTL